MSESKRHSTGRPLAGEFAEHAGPDIVRVVGDARGDARPLPGFDERTYAAQAGSEARTLASLLAE